MKLSHNAGLLWERIFFLLWNFLMLTEQDSKKLEEGGTVGGVQEKGLVQIKDVPKVDQDPGHMHA